MAKSKKTTKKFSINPNNFERNLMIVLLVAFLLSSALLLVRNNKSVKSELGEPQSAIERTAE